MSNSPILLIDLDGTLYTDGGAIPGAVDAIAELRRSGRPFRFVTNTTRRSRRGLVERLRGYGFEVDPTEVFTSVLAGARVLRERGVTCVAPFVAPATLEDLSEFELVGGTSGAPGSPVAPAAVLVGDLGDRWTPTLLNEAFRYVLDGALLVALQKDRYWLGATGLELDAGPYVAALEYATGEDAIVCGKPQGAFYYAALATLGAGQAGLDTAPGLGIQAASSHPAGASAARAASAAPAAMIGDDVWADVAGAQRAGLQGWLVRTGKFRADVLERSGVTPHRVLSSIADAVHAA